MTIDAGHPGFSWTLQFRARIDGTLIKLSSADDTGWDLFIRSSALFLEGSTSSMTFALDMEDTASVTDGTWHSLALTATSAGSKIFLDGYQCFSTTADLSPAASGPDAQLSLTPGAGIEIRSFAEHESVLCEARHSRRLCLFTMYAQTLCLALYGIVCRERFLHVRAGNRRGAMHSARRRHGAVLIKDIMGGEACQNGNGNKRRTPLYVQKRSSSLFPD